jgi:tetratricopeptide (TPR) repeat protein
MKSQHRHELETNWLAKRLNVAIERYRPYASTVVGVVIAVVLAILVWSYVAGSSSARQGEAWNRYNEAVIELQPNVEALGALAEEHPNTKVQQLADLTSADSQVFAASHNYLYDRARAMEALEKAAARYQAVMETSKDERDLNRARLGLARVYEIRGELDKAREEYLKVTGGTAAYAKAQAERLATPESKETYAWLANAEAVRPRFMNDLGAPTNTPDFSANDLALPESSPGGGAPAGTPGEGESLEKLLEGLNLDFEAIDEKTDPYRLPSGAPGQPASPPAQTEPPAQGAETTPEGETAATPAEAEPAQGEASSPATEDAPTQGDPAPAQEPAAAESASDSESDSASADADQPE